MNIGGDLTPYQGTGGGGKHWTVFLVSDHPKKIGTSDAFYALTYIYLDCQLGFEKRYQRWPKYESVCS